MSQQVSIESLVAWFRGQLAARGVRDVYCTSHAWLAEWYAEIWCEPCGFRDVLFALRVEDGRFSCHRFRVIYQWTYEGPCGFEIELTDPQAQDRIVAFLATIADAIAAGAIRPRDFTPNEQVLLALPGVINAQLAGTSASSFGAGARLSPDDDLYVAVGVCRSVIEIYLAGDVLTVSCQYDHDPLPEFAVGDPTFSIADVAACVVQCCFELEAGYRKLDNS